MGLDPEEIETVQWGYRLGLGEKGLTRIEIKGSGLRCLKVKFKPTLTELKERFPSLEFLGIEGSCCGCLLAMTSALNLLTEEGYRIKRKARLILGEISQPKPQKDYLFIGDCSIKGIHTPVVLFIAGCPPEKGKIAEALRESF